VSQLISAFCEACESSKKQSIGISHVISADINDVDSLCLNSFNLITLSFTGCGK